MVIFDHYGPGRRGIFENQQAEADRIAQRVLTEVVTILRLLLSTGHTRRSQPSLKPCKIRRSLSLFTLSPSEYETLEIECPPLCISTVPCDKNMTALFE